MARYRSKRATLDTFQNFAAKTGIGTNTLSTANTYGFNPITRNRTLLEWMYRGSWLCGVAVDCVADDMTREGINLSSAMDPDDKENLEAAIRNHQIWISLNQVAKWARLYGGALGYICIKGQKPDTPLNIDTVGPGQFLGIIPMDQWMTTPDFNTAITQPGPDYGNPQFYTVTATSPQFPFPRIRVHASRCVRMLGIELPYWQRTMENMWGISIYERIFDRLTAFDSTTQGAAQLAYKAYLRTFKVKGLRSIIATGGPAFEALTKQMELMRLYQSNEGITLMDDADTFETQEYTFSGISDILNSMAEQISGATQIPLARLFGQSPGGLNATGDHDLRTYYDNIKRLQERWFRRGLDVVLRCLAQSEQIELPDGFQYDFTSLWQMTDDEKSKVDQQDTQAVVSVQATGLLSPAGFLKELRQRGRATNRWQTISDADIKEAEKVDFVPGMSELLATGPEGAGTPEDGEGNSPNGIQPANQNERPGAAKKPSAKDSARLFDLHGLPIQIEHLKGETRRGGKGGHKWETVMPASYGYIAGLPSAEGYLEELDCFVGPDAASEDVLVINQQHVRGPKKGLFDEHKVMLGFSDPMKAISAYEQAFDDGKGRERIGSAVALRMDQFKAWIAKGDLTQPCEEIAGRMAAE